MLILQNLVLPFLRICIGMFQVIIICVRTYIYAREQPSKAKCFPIFIGKSICHYSISFAKNAAAFFKKRISFSSSAFCCLNLRFSSMSSGLDFCSSFVRHSSRYARTQFETVAGDTPYSAARLFKVLPS